MRYQMSQQSTMPHTSIRRQVFDLADGCLKVTEHQAQSHRCASCATLTKTTFPAGVRAPVQYRPGVLARAVYLHVYQLLPVARTAEAMRDLFGCALPPATIQRAAQVNPVKRFSSLWRL